MPNYYEILGVTIKATKDELESAYLKAISIYKEDSIATYGVVSEKEMEVMLQNIEIAFTTLKDTENRLAYDRDILKIDTTEIDNDVDEKRGAAPEETPHKRGKLEQLMLSFQGKDNDKKTTLAREEIVTPEPDSVDNTFYSDLTNLKEVRELKEITLRDIANETRISITYLRAIEEGNFSEMPETIYACGFIKAFAEHLDLNPEQFIASYRRHTGI